LCNKKWIIRILLPINKYSFQIFLILLLILIIPFRLGIQLFIKPMPIWANVILENGMYIIIGSLIWIKRNDLENFHIDKSSIIIFILSGTIFRIGSSLKQSLIICLMGLLILYILIKGKFQLKPRNSNANLWIIRSLYIGFFMPIILVTLSKLFISKTSTLDTWPGLLVGFTIFIYELSHVAVQEELIFRGFIWGYLKNYGLGDKKILIIQAIIFWITHLNYINKPYTFWVVVPIMSLVLGLIAWRSRSITYSAITHSMFNMMRFFV